MNGQQKITSVIGKRLVIYVVIFSFIITFITTVGQLYFDYQSEMSRMDSQFDMIDKLHRKILIEELWQLNGEKIQMQLNLLKKLPTVEHLSITIKDEERWSVGTMSDQYQYTKSYPLIYNFDNKNKRIGTLHVTCSTKDIYKRLFDKVIYILIANGIKTFLVSAFILFLSWEWITRHLTEVSQYMENLSLGNLDTPLMLFNKKRSNEKDEFDTLVNTINKTRETIKQSHEEIEERTEKYRQQTINLEIAEKELTMLLEDREELLQNEREYKNNLEVMVSKRTEELQIEINDRKKAEAAYIVAKEKAEMANQAKSQFLANVTHEIRTPLNGIIGYTEIMLASQSINENHRYANIIFNESEHLLHLINEILDGSKIESGKLELEQTHINLHELMKSLYDILRVNSDKKGLRLNFTVDEFVTPNVIGDPLRLRQILLNLANNAIKFTDSGTISITITRVRRSEHKDQVLHFSVRDTGIGIPLDKQKNIFDSFTQVDQSTSRKYGGTGLGTTIAYQLVKLMGGTLSLESQINEGSVFYFDIVMPVSHEISPPQSQPKAPVISQSNETLEILLAEDYPVNQDVIRMHLESEGYVVTIAENGKIAFEYTQKKRFNLILMDLQMPIMGGDKSTELIRSSGGKNATTPIVGLTANTDRASKQTCLQAGMNTVLSKPIRRLALLQEVHTWIKSDDTYTIAESTIESQFSLGKGVPNSPMDLNTAIEEFGDLAIVQEVAQQFITNALNQLVLINKALEKEDIITIQKEAHSIKGGAGTLEATPLYNAAKKLEQLCKNNVHSSTIKNALLEVDKEIQHLSQYIREIS